MNGDAGARDAPLVVCLVCGADDHPQRIGEIEALASELGGISTVAAVSAKTVAIRLQMPALTAQRCAAALSLFGATFVDEGALGAPTQMLVIIAAEQAETRTPP